MSKQHTQDSHQWWLGFFDFACESTAIVATRLEQVHLSIADETFDVLARVPVTNTISEPVREVHHGISRLSYRTVASAARLLNRVGQQAR
ncbi:hypothetical protein ACTXGQ_08400 [Marinobacter sp. 1Y8]